jgi:hypothetical protein
LIYLTRTGLLITNNKAVISGKTLQMGIFLRSGIVYSCIYSIHHLNNSSGGTANALASAVV